MHMSKTACINDFLVVVIALSCLGADPSSQMSGLSLDPVASSPGGSIALHGTHV